MKFDLFKLLVVVLILAFIGVGVKFITKRDTWITVELWGSGGEWWWNTGAPPYWVANVINAGDGEYDSGGKKICEIMEIKKYEDYDKKKFSLKAKLKVEKNKKTGKIKYKNNDLEIGSPLTLNLGTKTVTGNLTWIEGVPDKREKKNLNVTLKLYNRYPWQADAIKVGDTSTDGNNEIIAKILDKKVDLAEMTVVTDIGDVLARNDPLKRDITLKMGILALKANNQFFFSQIEDIKVGNILFIVMPSYNFEGTVTDFSIK